MVVIYAVGKDEHEEVVVRFDHHSYKSEKEALANTELISEIIADWYTEHNFDDLDYDTFVKKQVEKRDWSSYAISTDTKAMIALELHDEFVTIETYEIYVSKIY